MKIHRDKGWANNLRKSSENRNVNKKRITKLSTFVRLSSVKSGRTHSKSSVTNHNSKSEMEENDEETIDLSGPLFFPDSVQAAISEVFSTDEDPLDAAEFSAIDYINEMFPTEQSLTNLDDTIADMKGKISGIDDDLRHIVRGHRSVTAPTSDSQSGDSDVLGRSQAGVEDASLALAEAQSSILDLFIQIREIKTKAAESEATVRDITRDIKQLDVAKRNLTTAITTLNHLHMLVGGVITLKKQKEDRQYGDAANLLQGSIDLNFQPIFFMHEYVLYKKYMIRFFTYMTLESVTLESQNP